MPALVVDTLPHNLSKASGWDIGLGLLSLWMDVGASSAVIQAGA
jgi:hypothetical protein